MGKIPPRCTSGHQPCAANSEWICARLEPARPREYAIKNYLTELGTVATYKVSHAYWDRMIRMFNQIFRSELQPVLHIRAAVRLRIGRLGIFEPSGKIRIGLNPEETSHAAPCSATRSVRNSH